MKKILSIIGVVSLLFTSCQEPDNLINDVLDNYKTGAVLRTISTSGEFNYYAISTSAFTATIEAHDVEDGGLMQDVQIFVSADGGSEALVRTLTPSDFATGPTGLPRSTFTITLSEVANAISFSGGSTVSIRLQYNLTNGESYSSNDVSGSMTGSYFASPYQYNLIVGCFVVDGSAVPGIYTFTLTDSYGDGWQGSYISFVVDGVEKQIGISSYWGGTYGLSLEPGYSGNYSAGSISVEVPAGAQTMSMGFNLGAYPGETGWSVNYSELDGSNSQSAFSGGGGYGSDGLVTLSICR